MSSAEQHLHALITDDDLRESIDSIRRAVSAIWGGSRNDLPYVVENFTDHGQQHLKRVASRIEQLLEAGGNAHLDDLEVYVLLCGLYLHDIGMQCDLSAHPEVVQRAIKLRGSLGLDSDDLAAGATRLQDQGVLVRQYHSFLSAAWLIVSRETASGRLSVAAMSIPEPVVKDVSDVCLYHTKLDIRDCPVEFANYSHLRKRFIAALLRFADELDIDYTRVSRPDSIEEFNLPAENAAFWYLHTHTSVNVDKNGVLTIKLSLHPKDAETYGQAIEDRHIRRVIQKNQACLNVLWNGGIRLRVDESSSRVISSHGVQPIPEEYLKVLAGVSENLTVVKATPPEADADIDSEAKLIDLLYAGFNGCETVDDFVASLVLLGEIEPRVPSFTREVNSIRGYALTTLQHLTDSDPQRAGLILVRDLLPLCLEAPSPGDSERTVAVTRYRERLREWLYSYPIQAVGDARRGMVKALIICLQTCLVKEACWTLTSIGFRDDAISAPLWDAASSDDADVRDTALSTLAHLAYGRLERERLLALIEPALHREDFSPPLWSALKSFPEPRLVPILQDTWLGENPAGSDTQKPWFGLGLLADIADAFQEDAGLQRTTWRVVQDYAAHHFDDVVGRLYLGSDVTPRFDTRDVVLYLISLASADNAHAYRLDLVCRRLTECVRPEQVAAWSELSAQYMGSLYRLYSATCEDTGEASTSQTEGGIPKELAWEVLLRARFPDLVTPGYLADCILPESSRVLRGEALDWLSCFRIDSLPTSAIDLVTEQFDELGPAVHEYPVRKGATQFLCSVATKAAFDALLRFGYTIEGQIMAFSVEALSEVALHLASTDRDWVQQRLLEVALTGSVLRHRQAAVGALEVLASAGKFDADGIVSLDQLLLDESLPLSTRARVVNIIGLLPESVVPTDIRGRVVTLAYSDESDLSMRALMALARWDKLISYEDLMETRLGLVRLEAVWRWIEGGVPDSAILKTVGVLYGSNPLAFAPALAESLTILQPLTLQVALHIIRRAHRNSGDGSVPLVLWEAIATLISVGGKSTLVPLADCIVTMSELNHDRFSQFDWLPFCNEWDATVRQVLADALGENTYATGPAREAAIAHLANLARDGDYRVRRSSYRSLSRLDRARFDALCLAWASGPEVALRQRAAEACVWLEPNEKAFGILAQLSADVELGPREAVERAKDERRRNTWATMYLEHVTNEEDASNQSILDRWAYASALAAVGNDDSIHELRSFARSKQRAPHVRHWLDRIIDETERQWNETTKSYPGPWPYWEG